LTVCGNGCYIISEVKRRLNQSKQKQYNLSFSIDIVIEVENNRPPAMCLQGFIPEFAAALHARIDMDMYILEAEQ
jgi:hypothetical protein